jgi:hypothetical protein
MVCWSSEIITWAAPVQEPKAVFAGRITDKLVRFCGDEHGVFDASHCSGGGMCGGGRSIAPSIHTQ